MISQLEQREGEVRQLRGERRTVDEAVEELRTMLMQSVAERTRLAGALAGRPMYSNSLITTRFNPTEQDHLKSCDRK